MDAKVKQQIDEAIDAVVSDARNVQAEAGGDPDYRNAAAMDLAASISKLKKLIYET